MKGVCVKTEQLPSILKNHIILQKRSQSAILPQLQDSYSKSTLIFLPLPLSKSYLLFSVTWIANKHIVFYCIKFHNLLLFAMDLNILFLLDVQTLCSCTMNFVFLLLSVLSHHDIIIHFFIVLFQLLMLQILLIKAIVEKSN